MKNEEYRATVQRVSGAQLNSAFFIHHFHLISVLLLNLA